LGQAKARDVLALIDHARKTIAEKFGVTLVPEVEVIGEDT
jgi:UDP-N-acetylmuramate dehydrogenase